MTSRWRTTASICRVLPWFVALGLLKHLVPLPTLVRWSHRSRRPTGTTDARMITGYVLRAGAIAGVPDEDCLQRSLVLYRELSAAGLSPELAVGLRRTGGRLAGHAWVSVRDTVMAEPELDVSAFAQIVRFGDEGHQSRAAL